MIPILFKQNETEFVTNGIGKLSETISCIVEEARNGIYELSLKYPITGKFFDEIELKTVGKYVFISKILNIFDI